VTISDGQTSLRLGSHALKLPPEVAAVVKDHLTQINEHRSEAGHPEQRWLLPGPQSGKPIHVFSASTLLKEIGLPGPSSPQHRMATDGPAAPAAVLADGLGAQGGTAARHAKIASAEYASYKPAQIRCIRAALRVHLPAGGRSKMPGHGSLVTQRADAE